MPGQDGLSVSRLLKAGRAPLIIFVTAYDQNAAQAFQAHAIDYLHRPFDQELLMEALRLRQIRAGTPGRIIRECGTVTASVN